MRFTSSSTMTIAAANTLTLASGGLMGVGAASVVITGGTLAVGAASPDLIVHQNSTADMTISSVIAGAKGLTKSGTGRLVLGGANTYTGQTYLNQGTLSISSNANLGAPGTGAQINLDGGTLQATASFALNNGGANHRNIALADNGGTIDVTPSNALSVTGTITGNGGLTKTGGGSLTISAANTYTGNTVISVGELFIDGIQTAATGAVNVNGGTLGGNGTIGGLTTVANNALLAPGKSEGKLTFISGLNLGASDAKTQFEITGTSRGVLGGYDAVDISASGSLIYGGDLTLSMTTAIENGIYDLFSFTVGPTGSFDTIWFAGGFYTGSFVNNGSGVWTANTNGKLFTFNQSTGDMTVVPEPSTQLYLALGVALMFWFKRARRKSFPIAG